MKLTKTFALISLLFVAAVVAAATYPLFRWTRNLYITVLEPFSITAAPNETDFNWTTYPGYSQQRTETILSIRNLAGVGYRVILDFNISREGIANEFPYALTFSGASGLTPYPGDRYEFIIPAGATVNVTFVYNASIPYNYTAGNYTGRFIIQVEEFRRGAP